jgi:Xaa-Pro aminopeptidase
MMSGGRHTALELSRFRDVQKLAYRCAEDLARELRPGVTEKQAARELGRRLRAEGVQSFFHQPFAWFGDRTCFRGFRTPFDFFPSERRLESGMAAILDVAPIVDGYAADIGYAFACGDNPLVERGVADLAEFRGLIVDKVNEGQTLGEIYRCVEDLLADLGYRNCHRKYPFGVLAHRVTRQPRLALANRPVLGFGLGTTVGLLGRLVASRVPAIVRDRVPRLRWGSPFCNLGPGSEERPEPGLWAFEPHIARDDVGVKWEELLVVDEGRAYWLDDDLPHVPGARRS